MDALPHNFDASLIWAQELPLEWNRTFAIMLVVMEASGCAGCKTNNGRRTAGEQTVPEKSIQAVLQDHTEALMAIPGVVGTGQGLSRNKPCIKVFVVRKTAALQKQIPRLLEGYPVELEETGEIRPLPPPQS